MFRPVLIVVAVCLFLGGCRQSGPNGISEEQAKAAIARYLEAGSIGMQVSSVENIEADGDNAVAVCKMKDAQGLYGLAVTWRFTLTRTGNVWSVVNYTTR